ncbi:MAG: hypothetical protein FJ253_08330, partial [Phycisphaerae bacterium]|nr:hypothetical protein [Phycisphaerae bacterium]
MRVFLASLLPAEVGERLRTRGEARRTWLLVSLLLLSVIGVSVHSWDQARRARAIRAASISLRETAIDVDTELSRLEAERRELNDFMTTHRRVALPIEVSDLLATITNAMPAKATLTDLSIKLVSRDGAVRGALAAPP